jgi:Family of unknown function (DUF5694)
MQIHIAESKFFLMNETTNCTVKHKTYMHFKTKIILLNFSFILCAQFIFAQILKDPDYFLAPNKDSLPTIFLVGSFHFEYYNADAYKVEKSKQIDILSDKKQQELKLLLDYISIFKPTKICVEAPENWKTMDKYRLYKAGKKKLEKDEVQQIAFRLIDKFKLDTVYSIDARTIAEELPESKDSNIIKPYFNSIFDNYNFKANNNYNNLLLYHTELSLTIPLLAYFKYLNAPKSLQRDYGAYLVGDFKNGFYNGADALATYWYDRNLRIFRNIQKITTSPKDRILVLFGAGHIAILDQLLKSSPEYNYIPFNNLKK